MNKKRVFLFGGIFLVVVLIITAFVISLKKETPLRFEDYYLEEGTEFLKDFKSHTENENIIYEKNATFLDYEGTAYFIRDAKNNTFITNAFQMSLKSKLNEETIEKENIGILDKIKGYLKYEGLLDIHCDSTKEGVTVNYDKSVMRLLIDKEANISFDFYPNNQIFKYVLINQNDTIYATLKYEGSMKES